jgi:flagellin-like hook-associated protein FlgL
MRVVNDNLEAISDSFLRIRNLAIDATSTGNNTNLGMLAGYIKGIMDDIMISANSSFAGHYLFSGTLTTGDSIKAANPGLNDLPFEIIQGTVTQNNPSGLEVVFKGNNKERSINKDVSSTEVINITAGHMFGQNGIEVFQSVIDIYNLMTYKSDGTLRGKADSLNLEEQNKLDSLQKNVADIYEKLLEVSSENGTRLNRLDSISNQMTEESTRLKELLSIETDTDMANSTINMMKEETALQYTLQVGARLIPQSLFDFLA